MKRLMTTLIAAAALLVLGACEKHPGWRVILIEVGERDGGLETVETRHHDTAVVGPGDRITWKCRCPEGAQFRITSVTQVADVEGLYEQAGKLRPELPELRQRVEAGRLRASDPDGEGAGTASRYTEADLLGLLDAFFVAPPGQDLFAKPWPAADGEWTPGDGKIVSPPVRKTEYATLLYKFDAEVRLGDTTISIDPHIYNHGDEAKQ